MKSLRVMLSALLVAVGALLVTAPAHADTSPAPAAVSSAQVMRSSSASFPDVPSNHTFGTEIKWLEAEGITTGYDDGTFRPRSQVTREAMAAFMYRYAGEPEFTAPGRSPFPDVPTYHTFYKEITWLASEGITTGYNDGTFKPRNKISREAMAAFMYRFDDASTTGTAEKIFTDVTKSHAFSKDIAWMATNGISTGYAGKYGCFEYRPKGNVTREAMAAFMYRLANGGESFTMPKCNPPAAPAPTPKPTTPAPTPKPTQTATPKPPTQVAGYVTAGAYCAKAVAGHMGKTKTGITVYCKTSSTDSRLRWRQ